MEHQYHYGKKFYQDKMTGYWISTTFPRIRAHVWVWKNRHDDVEKGYHIHHIDGDKTNNDISNLEKLTVKEHISRHDSPERRAKNKDHVDKIRPLTKKWHCSHEGIEWHKEHASKTSFGKWDPKNLQCEMCSNIYQTTKKSKNKFCSNSCKSSWRRQEGLDNEERNCPICQNKFEVNKYAKTTTCSRRCGALLRNQKH